MSLQSIRTHVWEQVRQRDLRAFARLLTAEVLSAALDLATVPLGTGPLNRCTLIWLALASALHTALDFQAVLNHTIDTIEDGPFAHNSCLNKARRAAPAGGHGIKGDPRPRDPVRISEEAFTQARQLLPWSLWTALVLVLTERFEARHASRLRYKRFRLLTLDGTCLHLKAWKKLKDYFGTSSNGKGEARHGAQARLTMLQLPGVRLPWRYELTPITEGEKTVAQRLLAHLRPDDLVLMDRGFFCYGLFQQIAGRQAYFAIRLMSSVVLRPVSRLADGTDLVDWTPTDRRWAASGLPATMRLRRIVYQYRGFRPGTLLTNVLDPEAVSREEWLAVAQVDKAGRVLKPAGLYHRRWEVETTYFELKETQGLERGLRSRTPEGIAFEVGGHVVLYLLVRWLMAEAAAEADLDPLRLSYSGALGEVRGMSESLILASTGRAERVLLPRLRDRIRSHGVPLRPDRHYPRPNDTKPKNKGKGKKQVPSKLMPDEVAA
jgi:Transposase DDE domain